MTYCYAIHEGSCNMAGRSNIFKIIAFFALGIIVGAGFFQLYLSINQSGATPAPVLSLDQTYQNAVEDAMVAKPNEIYNGLIAIAESNGNLSWQGAVGNKSVLVVTFTKYASSYPVGETVNTTWGETWVTVAPEIKTFFKDHTETNTNLTLRTLQLLGLPPNNGNTYFVEMWVSPQSLFRPAPDNEITDTTAQLTFPASATSEYKVWFNNNIIYSYYPERFPWTRLGYTYDWGSNSSHVGLSEFMLKQNSIVTVKLVTSTLDYLSSSG
jgi:hypothetical protein